MNRILVLNGMSYASAVEGLGNIVYDDGEFLKQPEKFKLVLFTGGEDVTPSLYGETSPKGKCWYNEGRDFHEQAVFEVARSRNIPMAGICRGIQFLNVMAGGRLMHHIDNHSGSRHTMSTTTGDLRFEINSLHHQMVIPSDYSHIVGVTTTPRSKQYIGNHDMEIEYRGVEVEAAIFPEIRGFGVQYHPEMMAKNSAGYIYFHKMVENALTLDWRVFVAAYTEGLEDVHFLTVRDAHSASSG